MWRSPLQFVSLISGGQHFNVLWPVNTADPANNVFGLCALLDEQVLICAIMVTYTRWPIWAQGGTTHTFREVLRPSYSSARTSHWWPVDLYFVVRSQRWRRWSCVSLSQTKFDLLEEAVDLRCPCGSSRRRFRLQRATAGLVSDNRLYEQHKGVLPCTTVVTEFIYLAHLNFFFCLFLYKRINPCCPFTYIYFHSSKY